MRVLYSPRTQRDLAGIRVYIVAESGDLNTANRFFTRLLDACDALSILPDRYPPYRYAPHWRMKPFGNYLILFQVRGTDVLIGHIRHRARTPFR